MAGMTFEMGDMDERLGKLGSRESLRRILEAGTKRCIDQLQARTRERHHIVTGSMMESISGSRVHEDLGSVWQYVYPQGPDRNGKDNAVKAFVINYGRGGRKTRKTGDKFLTGKKNDLQSVVSSAMAAEADKVKDEIMR